MTSKQIMKDVLRVASNMEPVKNEPLQVRLDHEIDDETMCEGYCIFIPTTFIHNCGYEETIETIDGEQPDAICIMMEVKYEDCHPSYITFYDDEYKTAILRYRINDDLRNPFGIKQVLTEREWSISLVESIIIVYFNEMIKNVIYTLVKNM